MSAWTEPRTVVNAQRDHCSVIATLNDLHGLPALTDRDQASAPLFAAANRTTPRPASSWPVVLAPRVPRPPTSTAPRKVGRRAAPSADVLSVLLAKFEPGTVAPPDPSSAYEILVEHGHGLFGVQDDGLEP